MSLQEFHHSDDAAADRGSRLMVGLVIVAVMAAFGIYVYESGMWNPQPHEIVSDSQLPH